MQQCERTIAPHPTTGTFAGTPSAVQTASHADGVRKDKQENRHSQRLTPPTRALAPQSERRQENRRSQRSTQPTRASARQSEDKQENRRSQRSTPTRASARQSEDKRENRRSRRSTPPTPASARQSALLRQSLGMQRSSAPFIYNVSRRTPVQGEHTELPPKLQIRCQSGHASDSGTFQLQPA